MDYTPILFLYQEIGRKQESKEKYFNLMFTVTELNQI